MTVALSGMRLDSHGAFGILAYDSGAMRTGVSAMTAENIWQAFVIPMEGPCYTVDIHEDTSLRELQNIVGGYIEAIPLPDFIEGSERGSFFINEDGKYDPDCKLNKRATDFIV